jgi:UPF0716 protein FxsA
MFLLALLALPLAEVAAFVAVGLEIGWALAVGLLLGSSLVGAFLVRAEGRAALGRVALATSEGRPPGPAAVDAALGLLGAVLLMLPGFISAAAGVALLLPPTRRVVRRGLSRSLARRVARFAAAAERFGGRAGRFRPADVDATAVDDDQGRLDR